MQAAQQEDGGGGKRLLLEHEDAFKPISPICNAAVSISAEARCPVTPFPGACLIIPYDVILIPIPVSCVKASICAHRVCPKYCFSQEKGTSKSHNYKMLIT